MKRAAKLRTGKQTAKRFDYSCSAGRVAELIAYHLK